MGFDRNLNRWSEKSLEEAAAEEFGESPAILTSSLLSVKTWISQCPHLKQACTEDLFLTTFLRGCKFSLERTKEKLDNFHAIKTSLPEWFDNWDPKDPAVQEILSAGIFLPLPGFDREGRLVTLSRSGKVVPSKMKLDDLIRTSLMVMAVARAGEQQSVIRVERSLNCQRSPASAREVLCKCKTWRDSELTTSLFSTFRQSKSLSRWEKVLGLFVPRWLTYSTGQVWLTLWLTW